MTPLRQRMIEDMQVRNLSPHTQTAYVQQVSLFARYFNQSPEALGPEQIRAYQVHLTNEKKLAPGSILIAVAALRFLCRHTCALNTLQATGDIRKVALWLGHESIQSTEAYLRADPSQKREMLEAVLPPTLKRGSFRPTDKFIASLRGK